MIRRIFVASVCLCTVAPLVSAHAEIQVGAAMRTITPDPLLPVSGGMGTPKPAKEKRGELTARAIVFRKGDVSVAVVALDLLGFPSVLGDRVRAKVQPHPGAEHPDRLDPHAQRPRLLRLSRRQGGPHRRPRRTWTSSATRPPRPSTRRSTASQPACDQDRHRRGQGQDRLQLLRPRSLRPADERDPGGQLRTARRSPRSSTTRSTPKFWATTSASSAPTWSVRSATRIEAQAGGMALFMNGAQGGMITADNRNLDAARGLRSAATGTTPAPGTNACGSAT